MEKSFKEMTICELALEFHKRNIAMPKAVDAARIKNLTEFKKKCIKILLESSK